MLVRVIERVTNDKEREMRQMTNDWNQVFACTVWVYPDIVEWTSVIRCLKYIYTPTVNRSRFRKGRQGSSKHQHASPHLQRLANIRPTNCGSANTHRGPGGNKNWRLWLLLIISDDALSVTLAKNIPKCPLHPPIQRALSEGHTAIIEQVSPSTGHCLRFALLEHPHESCHSHWRI